MRLTLVLANPWRTRSMDVSEHERFRWEALGVNRVGNVEHQSCAGDECRVFFQPVPERKPVHGQATAQRCLAV